MIPLTNSWLSLKSFFIYCLKALVNTRTHVTLNLDKTVIYSSIKVLLYLLGRFLVYFHNRKTRLFLRLFVKLKNSNYNGLSSIFILKNMRLLKKRFKKLAESSVNKYIIKIKTNVLLLTIEKWSKLLAWKNMNVIVKWW